MLCRRAIGSHVFRDRGREAQYIAYAKGRGVGQGGRGDCIYRDFKSLETLTKLEVSVGTGAIV